ncbi:hypothetical protein I549_1292 [Mycobacterium avium subsp. avium 2285 (R)]|nr:hypothetical protein I549_1292 [Mycobacterium avium subsp. avium 2285 (R)]
MDPAGPRPRAGLDELHRRGRSGRPGGSLSASGAPTGVGGSLVASPLGEVVASAGAQPQLVLADIDVDRVAQARKTIAALSNRSDFAQVGRAESVG